MLFQWYPGHMTKTKRMMQENIKLIDVVIELVDARVPLSSKNPDIDQIAGSKPRIILINKYDLADPNHTREWEEYYKNKGFYTSLLNSKQAKEVDKVKNLIFEACKERIERNKRRGMINKPIRAMIVGIPNVGKSTFINSIAKKASAKTGNKPGVTKGKQWIRINKDIELLDTPGILWPKFEDQTVGLRLALIGSIKDEILQSYELAIRLIEFLKDKYPSYLEKRYEISLEGSEEIILEDIARRRGCVIKGGELDLDKAANLLLDEFRNGKLGRITLELPEGQD
ncbi:MAG: ribosome biogenesis GTPase YlqF [Clostridiales bacterium]|nr:ribosome biogenesis GTPase YlqF [Clostridiales bacterium]